ncbi:hypothetical protein [Burkholderia gladioli]|uniref:hypothetical protein n=1 Tax=Burkholderia gladioli TaxID=28095 RepID=UPI00163E4ABF|nr:hypothetical protein [Burkholderia gladioli]MDN7804535.1 hypothetical protein [Burkholderia gladioli]
MTLPSLLIRLTTYLTRRLTSPHSSGRALRILDALASASVGFPPLTPAEIEWVRFTHSPAEPAAARRPDEGNAHAAAVRFGMASGSR